MIYVFHALLLAWIIALKFRVIDGRISPDGQRYLNMATGRETAAPYCHRILIPWLVRLLPAPALWPFRIVAATGTVLSVVLVDLAAMHFGASPWGGFAAACAWIGCEAGFGLWLFLPWLVDSWAVVFALSAVIVSNPVAAAALLVASFLTKEAIAIFGWAFAWGLGAPAWIGLPGLLLFAAVKWRIKGTPGEREWLTRPFWYAHTAKRRFWFHFDINVMHLKSSPWLALYVLPGSEFAWPCLLVYLLAFSTTMVASDHARLVALAFPFIISVMAGLLSPPLLAIWAASSLFWPFRVDANV